MVHTSSNGVDINTGSDDNNIQELLSHPRLWRAAEIETSPAGVADGLSTGYPALDKRLAAGGWPRSGLVELLADQTGIGELRLLAPALAALSRQEQRWLLWVNPPHIPYAPALAALGVAVEKVLLVHPKREKRQEERREEALWSLEQALRFGSCSVALGWLDEERELGVRELRRLQLAARDGGTLTVLFRPRSAAAQASMAELRILLQAAADGHDRLELEIIKRRGGWPLAPFALPLRPAAVTLTAAQLREHVECWRKHRRDDRSVSHARFP